MAGPAIDEADRAELERRTERWFVKRGLPHFIDRYSATTDIFTRAAGFLAFVFVIELLNAIREDFAWWQNLLALVGAVAITVGGVATINRARGRPPFSRPRKIGVLELAGFVLIPALIPLVLNQLPGQALDVAVGNLVLLVIVYVVTSYGLVPMTRWAISQLVHQISNVTNLFVRSLPLLVLFTMFMFFNAELWKITDDLPDAFLWISPGMLVVVGSAFVLLRFPRELRSIAGFDTWADVAELAAGTPVADIAVDGVADPPPTPHLARRARLNVGLVLFASQSMQILLVTATIGLFYVAFGMFTVVPSTIEQWTGSDHLEVVASWTLGDNEVVLSRELIRTAVFIAAVAGLQFTVAALTDSTYREEFHDEVSHDIRQAFAVRTVYLERVVDGWVGDERVGDGRVGDGRVGDGRVAASSDGGSGSP
jgi:hypothetical protein